VGCELGVADALALDGLAGDSAMDFAGALADRLFLREAAEHE
jgi:hypothetical protein